MNKQQINPFNQFLEDRLSSIRDTYQVSIDYTYDQDASAYLVKINNSELWEEEEFQDSLTDISYDAIDIPHSRPILFVSPTDRHATFVPTHSLSVKTKHILLKESTFSISRYNYNSNEFSMKKILFSGITEVESKKAPSFDLRKDSVKDNYPAAAV